MSKNGTRQVPCLHCGNLKLHHSRGLCKCCYNHATERGYLHLYPTLDDTSRAQTVGLGSEQRLHSLARHNAHPWMQGGLTQ